MRIVLRILSVVALIISVAWFYFEQGYEPALAVVVSLSALISTFFLGKNKTHGKEQNQTVGNRSNAIQAGGDVSVSIENNSNRDD